MMQPLPVVGIESLLPQSIQALKSDANLLPKNGKKGMEIFFVAGLILYLQASSRPFSQSCCGGCVDLRERVFVENH